MNRLAKCGICTQCFKWLTSLSLSVWFVNYSSYIGLQTPSMHCVLNRINYDVAKHLKTVWEITYQSLMTVRYLDLESLPQDVKPSRGWIGPCLTKCSNWARAVGNLEYCIRRIAIEKLIAVTQYQIFIPTDIHQNIINITSYISR